MLAATLGPPPFCGGMYPCPIEAPMPVRPHNHSPRVYIVTTCLPSTQTQNVLLYNITDNKSIMSASANTKTCLNAGLMLVHCPSIKPALFRRFISVIAGSITSGCLNYTILHSILAIKGWHVSSECTCHTLIARKSTH